MIFTISVEALTALISSICAIFTAILIPLWRAYRKEKKKVEQRISVIDSVPDALKSIETKLNSVREDISKIDDQQLALGDGQEILEAKFDQFETQQLKHIINDAFFGYKDITEIPDEVLVNASQCCDIYLGKGLNHETGARCELIYEELKRRQRTKAYPSRKEDE